MALREKRLEEGIEEERLKEESKQKRKEGKITN
jgi:hypothetical protein